MKKQRAVEVLVTDADGFAENELPALAVLDISRREIESGNIASALERLLVMVDTREAVYRYRESVLIQVRGYDNDPRELPEIREVRTFFARLTQEWPDWFWFLCRRVGAIQLLLSLLCKVKIHRAPGSFGTEFVDKNELQRTIMDLFSRGNALFESYGVTDVEAEASANSAMTDLIGE